MSGHCKGVCPSGTMVCPLVRGSTRDIGCRKQVRKPLIFMRFHGVFLGRQHEIWSKQHNGKVSSMLDKDADATQGGIGCSLLIAQLRVGVLLTLARFLRRDGNLLPTVRRFHAEIAEIDKNIKIDKPIHLRGDLLFQHDRVVIVSAKGPPKKDNKLVRQRPDRVFQRMLFFFPLECSRCLASSGDR